MQQSLSALLATLVLCAPGRAQTADTQTADAQIRQAVVKVWSTARSVNLSSPWKMGEPQGVSGSGVWLGNRRVLTNAHLLQHAGQVSMQPYDSPERIPARVEMISPEMDLAILEVDGVPVLENRQPIPLEESVPPLRSKIQTYGYPVGGSSLSVTEGIVSRIEFVGYAYGAQGLRLQVDAALNPGNSGGPVIMGGKLIGIVTSRLRQSDNIGYVIPGEEIGQFLRDTADGRYHGKPALHVVVQKLLNQNLRNDLSLPTETTGVWIRKIYAEDESFPLQVGDVITQIGSQDIDNSGMARLAEGLRVSFFYFVSRLARDNRVPLTILRDGHRHIIETPVGPPARRLIPALKQRRPSYFIYGPLVFTEATAEYVESIEKMAGAADVRQRAAGIGLLKVLSRRHSPLLLRRYDLPAFKDEQLVMVASNFLRHRINLGYSSPQTLVLASVNGTPIRHLRHLVETLRKQTGSRVTFEFTDRDVETLVFNRQEMLQATSEILSEHDIPRVASPDLLPLWESPP